MFENRDLMPTVDARSVFKGLLRDQLGWAASDLDGPVFPDSANAKGDEWSGEGVALPRLPSAAGLPQAGWRTPLSTSSDFSSPDWNISLAMSQPPTNSPFT